MSHRFFLRDIPTEAALKLSGEQAHHAANVMRFKTGDTIEVFDGRGNSCVADILGVGKKQLTAEIRSRSFQPPDLIRPLTLAVALPKGDRQKFLVEKLVELGVRRLLPLKTRRSVSVGNDKVIERLNKQVVEACKQCGRNWLMAIQPEVSIDELSHVPQLDSGGEQSALRLLADPGCDMPISGLCGQVTDVEVIAAVGPEGGFDSDEVDQLTKAGWQKVGLGPSILRVETAALAIASVLGIGEK